jgi:type IV pilus assembly protein PilE
MEQYFQDNRTYVGGTGCTADTSSSKYYDFSCASAATATAYIIQAVGKDSMLGFTFTIDQSNQKNTTAVPTAAGWSLPAGNCWVTKKGGVC